MRSLESGRKLYKGYPSRQEYRRAKALRIAEQKKLIEDNKRSIAVTRSVLLDQRKELRELRLKLHPADLANRKKLIEDNEQSIYFRKLSLAENKRRLKEMENDD